MGSDQVNHMIFWKKTIKTRPFWVLEVTFGCPKGVSKRITFPKTKYPTTEKKTDILFSLSSVVYDKFQRKGKQNRG